MATFRVYAKVLTPEDQSMKAYAAGILRRHPGVTLHDLLKRSGGAYETKLYVPPLIRERLQQVGELTSDKHLLTVSELSEVPVSLEHLRDVDPQTRIMVRGELLYAPGESERLGLTGKVPPDPRRSILEE